MSFILHPYDGVGNIPDAMFRWFWDAMVEQGLAEVVFYSGLIVNADEFINLMKTHVAPTIGLDEDTLRPVFLAWLSDAADNHAFGHFCVLKDGRGYKVEMGKEMVRYWMDDLGLDPLLGIVPSFNKPAIKYMRSLGAVFLGEIPKLVRHNGVYKTAFFGYFSREEL